MKIALVHNQALPYRHFLFESLAQNFDLEFFLFNQAQGSLPRGITATVLKGYRLPRFSDWWIQPGLKKALSAKRYDLIIGGDLGAFNTATAFRVAQRSGTPFMPWVLEWAPIRHPRRWLRRGFERRLVSGSAAMLTPGVKHRDYLLSLGARAGQLAYLPNCVPPPKGALNSTMHQEHPLFTTLVARKKKTCWWRRWVGTSPSKGTAN